MKLQLKRSNVLELGAAKEPTAAQMEYGELAVNYNNGDPAIFLKDSNDNIIRIAGVGSINSGDTPSGGVLPPTGNNVGDVFFNTTNNTMYYWDGTQWVPIANDVTAADIFVGTLAEIDAEVPKADRRNGFLWWNTEDGTLYIWYIDANTSQWVIAIPSSGGGGGGASVAINNVPPTSADQGDMWWNTTDGRLYIWYQDADTGQWVDASPDSHSPGAYVEIAGDTMTGQLTLPGGGGATQALQKQEIEGLIDSATYWDRNGTTLRPVNVGDGVVAGSAEFAGSKLATETLTVSSADTWNAVFLNNNDAPGDRVIYSVLGVKAFNGASHFLECNIAGVGPVQEIFGDGSAWFSSSRIRLNEDGSGDFSNALRIGGGGVGNPNTTIASDGQIVTNNVITSTPLAGSGTRPVYADASGGLTISSSDRKLKTNINTIPSQVDQVKALNPVSFNWINKERLGDSLEIGFIVQEVEQVVPEVVRLNTDGTLALDYPKLTATLTSALQTALTRIEALEAKVTSLEGGNN